MLYFRQQSLPIFNKIYKVRRDQEESVNANGLCENDKTIYSSGLTLSAGNRQHLEARNEFTVMLTELLKELIVHFDLQSIFDKLQNVVPTAVEMNLFILSETSKSIFR